MNYEVQDYQTVSVVKNSVESKILAVKVRYYDTNFENITTLELDPSLTDADITAAIVNRGTELKNMQVDTRNFSTQGTI